MNTSNNLDLLKQRNLKKYQVVILDHDGVSNHEISRRLDMDRRDVRRILDKYANYGSVDIDLREENPGRPPKMNAEQKEDLRNRIIEGNLNEFADIKDEVEAMEIEIGDSTLRKILAEIGKYVIPSWVPALTDDHRRQRREYCQDHIQKGSTFKNIIFTDECRFYLNRKTRKVYVIKGQDRPGKVRCNPDSSIMVWGSICYEGIIYMEVVIGRMKHEDYIQILQRFVTYGMRGLKSRVHWRFQQDGAPPHRPQEVKDFLKESGLWLHEHPPNSPDLNPLETIWGFMKHKIEEQVPTSKQELENAIFNVWENLDLELFQSCINHLRSYLRLVVDVEGGWPQLHR